MTVEQLKEKLHLEPLNEHDLQREVSGGYAGDLLSWVMGRAQSDHVWVTIMTNINILAVASLSDLSCVIISESSEVTDELVHTAKAQEINLFRSEIPTFELCAEISRLLQETC